MMNQDRWIAVLDTCFPFCACAPYLAKAAAAKGQFRVFPRGEKIIKRGEWADACFFILDGEVLAYRQNSDQSLQHTCFRQGSLIGLESFDAQGRYDRDMVAVNDVTVFYWPRYALLDFCDDYPDFDRRVRLLREGDAYQKEHLNLDTEVIAPILCAAKGNPLYFFRDYLVFCVVMDAVRALLNISDPLYFVKRPVLPIVLGLPLLYRMSRRDSFRRLLLTPESLILFSDLFDRKSDHPTVIHMADISGVTLTPVHPHPLLRLLPKRICLQTEGKIRRTSPLVYAEEIRDLIVSLCPQCRKSREDVEREKFEEEQRKKDTRSADVLPKTFHAHWMLLVKMLFPLLIPSILCLGLFDWAWTENLPHAYRLLLIWISAILWVGICLRAAYVIYDWWHDYFIVEEEALKDINNKPLQKQTANIALVSKVESVRIARTGIPQLMMDYGTVYIMTGLNELSFDYVPHPAQIQALILRVVARYRDKMEKEAEQRQNAYIRDLTSEILRAREELGQ